MPLVLSFAATSAMVATAAAASTEPPPAPEAERPPAEPPPPAFSVGALAGIGFPRPVSVELLTKMGGYVGLGAEYGFLPALTVEGVSASAWAATFDARVFPFRGAFFVACRLGYQRISASASVSTYSASAELDTWLINPRLGFAWTFRSGFTLATEAGVQLPLTSSFSTTLPDSVALAVRDSTVVKTLSGALPTVDLLRLGVMF